ncbi:Phosphoethanolamine N-methyltransferase 1 [Tolypocladium ophioglossoides CBS 100239]|uniref:Phosphoethanolamine N-methyltransferase 1 n=1 Tax=Tolypocladium ophioglossoides (strain CBS 100239) TaxID=1163406 RepID=A0A0L0NCQ2_TOLOC|nr:Phosphoethanolamine N-methyltransferase 1 [Tolypocladium ophioglossoides CBS 100239]
MSNPPIIIIPASETSDIGSLASSLTSIATDILHGEVGEGRRTYAVYGKEEYGLPMDEQELERMDICHAKYGALLDKRHFLSPIGEYPQRILDLGCGTGIWCIDMAEKFPSAKVLGVDIAPTQPQWVPPNCSFELDDIEQPWTWKEDTADFIFARDLIVSIRDFPKLIDQCYRHLKPGGWLEFHCVTGVLQCDDCTVPKDSTFQRFSDLLKTVGENFGTPVDDPMRWKQWFEKRGFCSVTEKVFKMPSSPWPQDKRLKLIGAWEQHNLLSNLEGMMMRPFHKGLGWTEEEVTVFSAALRKDIRNLDMHAYWPFYTVYGQKPFANTENLG